MIVDTSGGRIGDVRTADSTTLAAVTSAAVAAFDADISKAVEERSAAVQRAAEAEAEATDSHVVDDDDGQGELTLGQLAVDNQRSDLWNGTQVSWVSTHSQVRQTSQTHPVICRPILFTNKVLNLSKEISSYWSLI